jgi:hypothetical protein
MAYTAPPATSSSGSGQQQKKQWSGNKGGGSKAEFDPRLTEKDFAMAGQNALNAATATVTLEVQQRTAAGGVFPEADILGRVQELTELFYQGTIARRKDMERKAPSGTASAASTPAPAQAAPSTPQAAPAAPSDTAQAAATVAQATTGQQAPEVPNVLLGLPHADELVTFGKHAIVDGVKGQPHLTIAEVSQLDPGWLHWVCQADSITGKYKDVVKRGAAPTQGEPFRNRVIEFVNAAEAAGAEVPNPPK